MNDFLMLAQDDQVHRLFPAFLSTALVLCSAGLVVPPGCDGLGMLLLAVLQRFGLFQVMVWLKNFIEADLDRDGAHPSRALILALIFISVSRDIKQ